ncbi:hypothetical protein EBT16_10375, partial [bacterium]|nr:hypothetical protein [bacterium]
MNKINEDKTFVNFCSTFNRLIKNKGINAYPTSYGIGVFSLFGGKIIQEGKEEITFKSIKKDVDISKLGNGEYTLDEVVDNAKSLNKQYILGDFDGHEF